MISKLFDIVGKHIDAFLMACLFFTVLLGLFVLYSASGQNIARVYGQGLNIIAVSYTHLDVYKRQV